MNPFMNPYMTPYIPSVGVVSSEDRLSAALALARLGNNESAASTVLPCSQETNHSRPTKKKNFPMQLFDILEKPEHHDVVRWLPGGKAFIIMDKKRFADEILSVYFKKTQFASFARKLTRWKFIRVPKGPYAGAYYHKLYRRDLKPLCDLMTCDEKATSLRMPLTDQSAGLGAIIGKTMPQPQPIGLFSMPALSQNPMPSTVNSIADEISSLQLKTEYYKQQILKTQREIQHSLQQQEHVTTIDDSTKDQILEAAKKVLDRSHFIDYNAQLSSMAELNQHCRPSAGQNKISLQGYMIAKQQQNVRLRLQAHRNLSRNMIRNCRRASAA